MPSSEFDFAQWKSTFQNCVRESRRIQAIWNGFVDAGCSPDVMTRTAAYACDFDGSPGNTHLFEDVRDEWQQAIRASDQVSHRLEAVSKEAVELLSEQNKLALMKASAEAIQELKRDAETFGKILSWGEMSPTPFLVELVNHIREHTGGPHYREVSELLDAAYAAYGKQDLIRPGEEALRKSVERFKRKHPETDKAHNERGVWAVLVLFILWLLSCFQKGLEKSPETNSDDVAADKPEPPSAAADKTPITAASPGAESSSESVLVLQDFARLFSNGSEDKTLCGVPEARISSESPKLRTGQKS